MIDLKNYIEASLEGKIKIEEAIEILRKDRTNQYNKVDSFKIDCGLRLLIGLKQYQLNINSIKDLAILIRQFILYTKLKFRIPDSLKKELKKVNMEFSLYIDVDNEVSAEINIPSWFKQGGYLKKVYDLEEKKRITGPIGDNLLLGLTGFNNYRSFAQKIAVYQAINMPEGSSLLISLPTGGGKSIVGQIMAYTSKGLTIVIVPTVALAIDQERSAKRFFGSNGRKEVVAYYGGINYDEKKRIIDKLRNNKVSILYISPEAIIKGDFGELILDLAKDGKIENLIVDEAHLVIDWGDFFRTEFQFLSIYRKKLMDITENKIRTILLSATYTDDSVYTLKQLFSEENNWLEVRADSLRQEPIYSADANKTEEERKDHVIELIHLLPRPLILYVSTRNDAKEWKDIFLDEGFKNIEIFTGDTRTNDRNKIIQNWTENKLDLIIATSAFGMGVDKPDIRSIIHACIPENPNRFYQEVGRGGRDGLNSISVISSFTTEDKKIANDLTKNQVLLPDTILKRWISLYDKRQMHSSSEFWLDMSTKPSYYEEERIPGLTNNNWNEYVVLFLARYGFLSLIDFTYDKRTKAYNILIRINKIDLLDSENMLEWIELNRIKERENVDFGLRKMKGLVDKPTRACWSEMFSEFYILADENCNGCPHCYRYNQHERIYEATIKEIIETPKEITSASTEEIDLLISTSGDLIITHKSENIIEKTGELGLLVRYLLKGGVNRFIIPTSFIEGWDRQKKIFSGMGSNKHMILSAKEAKILQFLESESLLSGIFLIIFGEDHKENNDLYDLGKKVHFHHNKVIYLAKNNLHIKSQGKDLNQLIEGHSIDMDKILRR